MKRLPSGSSEEQALSQTAAVEKRPRTSCRCIRGFSTRSCVRDHQAGGQV